MIKLYGFALSNYYNMAKLSLLEKGIDFEEVAVQPSQEADYLAKSPMGKVPCIETSEGFLSETNAIMEYLESSQATPNLFPSDAYGASKVRELMKVLELYIELPARRHYNEIFFGGDHDKNAFDEVKPVIQAGLDALKALGKFDPYITGSDFTFADIVAAHTFIYAAPTAQAVYKWDIIAEVPGLQATLDGINERDAAKKVGADQQAAMEEFMAQK